MKLTDILAGYENTDRTYVVYYAHKNSRDDDGYLQFRRGKGAYRVAQFPDVKDVEMHARKSWAQDNWMSKVTWDDQNYLFLVVLEENYHSSTITIPEIDNYIGAELA